MVAEGTLDEISEKLSIQRTIHAQVTNLTDELFEKIAAIEGVSKIDRQIDRLAIAVREHDLSIEDFHDELVKVGARLRMFQPEAMDMETVFMKLTEGKTA